MTIEEHIKVASDHLVMAMQALDDKQPHRGTDSFYGLLESAHALTEYIKQSEYSY